jgi:hypothetical protein
MLWFVAADPPVTTTLFAEAAWYRQAAAPEQSFEGVLEKQPSPMASSGRWNPVGLKTPERIVHAIYLGGNNTLLDGHIGERVRIEGKIVSVLEGPELWPARLTVLDDRQPQ